MTNLLLQKVAHLLPHLAHQLEEVANIDYLLLQEAYQLPNLTHLLLQEAHLLPQEVAHLACLLIFTLPFDNNRLEPSVAESSLAFLKGGEVSCKCVLVIGTFGPLKSWPEVTQNMEAMKGLAGKRQGLLQVCVILLTLPAI